MTMANSIEGRAPFLQRGLVQAALALPDDQVIFNASRNCLVAPGGGALASC